MGDVADRRTDRHDPAHPRRLGVDDDQLAATLVGDGGDQPLAGGIDTQRVDAGAGTAAELDGADPLGRGVDHRDRDTSFVIVAGVHALAVRADGECGGRPGERERGGDGAGGDLDHRQPIVVFRRRGHERPIFGCDRADRFPGHQVRGEGQRARIENRHGVVAGVSHESPGVPHGDIADGAAADCQLALAHGRVLPSSPQHRASHTRRRSAIEHHVPLGHQNVCHVSWYLRRLTQRRP